MTRALETEIKRRIAIDGPISVAEFMALCLGHPVHGYYARRDPFGRAGDFVTAPEISQMFGELIGLWAAAVWQAMGAPAALHLVELGPGRGTLMADALRAAKVVPAFRAALDVHLVETSPALRRIQQERLSGFAPADWHTDVAALPAGPSIVIANEFFDALPVHQAVRGARGWHERMVGLDADGQLMFALHPDTMPGFEAGLPDALRGAPPGALYEWRSDAIVAALFGRLARDGGALLAIDYGHVESGFGETLQAVGRHAFADPLRDPGQVDLTAHVDFAALAATARRAGTRVHGPIGQGEFLRRLGVDARAAKLKAGLEDARAAEVDAALARLTAVAAGGMGGLFKAMALAHPALGALPGFDR